MRFLIVDTYYPEFLNEFYRRRPEITERPYAEHWRALMDECFGAADSYSSNLVLQGHQASEVIANCEPLQRSWAAEHGVRLDKSRYPIDARVLIDHLRGRPSTDWIYPVLAAQVEHYKPDVLYVQNMNFTSAGFLAQIRSYVRLIAGQIACPKNPKTDFGKYDLILSSFPHFVAEFLAQGLQSEYFKLGFEPRILARLNTQSTRRYPVVFVGGLSASHSERIQFLESVAASCQFDMWGYHGETLPPNSRVCAFHHGEVWALGMYQLLHDSRIALNHHINISGRYANNMRLYEATGVGTLLITDHKDNIADLFEPGTEVLTYHSPEECAELVGYYLSHEDERNAIARAGQTRTLREHTYSQRMQELAQIVEKHLR